jgi:hypothetical protein
MEKLKPGGINIVTEKGIRFQSWEEFKHEEEEPIRNRMVKKNRREIILPIHDVFGNPYVIERSRCSTPEQCLDWVHQISEKDCVWEDGARIMREFLELLFEVIPSKFWAGVA